MDPVCNVSLCNHNNIVVIANIQVTVSSFWLSLAFVNSSIFMKNWRIFRIFHNPHQKERVCAFYVYKMH